MWSPSAFPTTLARADVAATLYTAMCVVRVSSLPRRMHCSTSSSSKCFKGSSIGREYGIEVPTSLIFLGCRSPSLRPVLLLLQAWLRRCPKLRAPVHRQGLKCSLWKDRAGLRQRVPLPAKPKAAGLWATGGLRHDAMRNEPTHARAGRAGGAPEACMF